MTVLRVRDLGVTLDDRCILRDVSFDVDEGETIAVIGPNGSGKTVLLKSLLGMLPHSGAVEWRDGVSIGYVPQKVDADRTVPLNPLNLLRAKAHILGIGEDAVAATVARVNVPREVLTAQIGKLSGGQFQRMLIAFALLGGPQAVLFDEPTASMDEPGEEQIYELIRRLEQEMKIAAIVVSHDHLFVERFADRVFSINRCTLEQHPAHA